MSSVFCILSMFSMFCSRHDRMETLNLSSHCTSFFLGTIFEEKDVKMVKRVALFYIFLDYPDISNSTSVFEEWEKITSIPSRMMLVSAKEGQIQTWWFFLDIFSFEQMLIPTFTPNFQLWPVFLEKFSSRIYIRENRDILQLLHQQQEDNELTTRTRVSLKNLPHGQQSYHTDTKLTTRTPVSSKIFGLASIRVRATTWGGFGNFRRQLSIWSKVKECGITPCFATK